MLPIWVQTSIDAAFTAATGSDAAKRLVAIAVAMEHEDWRRFSAEITRYANTLSS